MFLYGRGLERGILLDGRKYIRSRLTGTSSNINNLLGMFTNVREKEVSLLPKYSSALVNHDKPQHEASLGVSPSAPARDDA